MPKYRHAAAGILTLLLAGGVAAWVISERTDTSNAVDAAELVSADYWHRAIAAFGGTEAYELLDKASRNASTDERHEYAHVFGGALYKAEGADALFVCDARFSYGCFHEFVGRAIAERGLAAAETLNDACIKGLGERSAFCQHGVGHGLQTYFGYSRKNLDEALAVCGALRGNDPIGGCSGGIFMEYNFRTMLADEGVIRVSEDVFAPCNRLTGSYLESCVFWEPQWWHESLVEDGVGRYAPGAFRLIGERCESVSESPSLVEICFRGVGNLMLSWDREVSGSLCQTATDNVDYQQLCVVTAHQ